VEFVAVKHDGQQLQISDAETKIQSAARLTKGLGSGAEPNIGHWQRRRATTNQMHACAAGMVFVDRR